MPRLTLIITLTIAILAPAQRGSSSAAAAPGFVSLDGRFSISLPDPYTKLTRLIIPTPSGGAAGRMYEWKIDETIFGVGYADFFQSLKDPETVKQIFDGATASENLLWRLRATHL